MSREEQPARSGRAAEESKELATNAHDRSVESASGPTRDEETSAEAAAAEAETAEGAEEASSATPVADGQGSRSDSVRRLAFGGPRSFWSGLMAAVLAVGLGFAVMTQVQQNEKSGLSDLSQADLVALLANVNDQSTRLEKELGDLKTSKEQLARGGDQAAVTDARKRLDQLAILNGTVQVQGPGIVIDVDNSKGDVTAANVLDAVQELRDAGAEAIDVGGNRVVAASWFTDVDGEPAVEGHRLADKFTVSAIGDPHTMSTAMAIPGGVTDTLTQAGARVKVSEDTTMQITSLHRND